YRIATEAVTNVVRHADADRCTVRLEVAGDRLRLEVADDGCGLPSVVHAGVGTRSIAERAAEIGGTAAAAPWSARSCRWRCRDRGRAGGHRRRPPDVPRGPGRAVRGDAGRRRRGGVLIRRRGDRGGGGPS